LSTIRFRSEPNDLQDYHAGEALKSRVTVSIGITGHRAGNAAYAANRLRIEKSLDEILGLIERTISAEGFFAGAVAPTRMHSMLADGADQAAAKAALAHGWELVSPLPFGRALNTAINALPADAGDARALLAGRVAADPATQARAEAIRELSGKARIFELADQDDDVTSLFLAKLDAPNEFAKAQLFHAQSSRRAALASRIVIEQSDIILAVWDGVTTEFAGGTGHTIAAALDTGAPVVWIDAKAPESWRILRAPESIATMCSDPASANIVAEIEALVREALQATVVKKRRHRRKDEPDNAGGLARERWRPDSNPVWHAYRRVEALFGAETPAQRFRRLRQSYETPDAITTGSAAGLLACARAMPGQDEAFVSNMETSVLRRFAWFDGVSSRLADNYRSGMVINFLLAPFAIGGGLAYLPFGTVEEKWIFALSELVLLASIIGLTALGHIRRWHGRWFQTRRVAEYFRHAPILLLLGVARAPGRWPRGVDANWPESFARQALREIGLPRVEITQGYLRTALSGLLDDHVTRQRDYHIGKAQRLASAHHNLDRFSGLLFALAVLSIAVYLLLRAGGAFRIWPAESAEQASYIFTFLGALLPTLGSTVAGIRYFGDFERFSAISEVTAEKLDAVHRRIQLLLSGPDSAIDYGRVSDLAHTTDEIVVAEIENWQAVFGGKHITVPV
jgi:hypothetical protein